MRFLSLKVTEKIIFPRIVHSVLLCLCLRPRNTEAVQGCEIFNAMCYKVDFPGEKKRAKISTFFFINQIFNTFWRKLILLPMEISSFFSPPNWNNILSTLIDDECDFNKILTYSIFYFFKTYFSSNSVHFSAIFNFKPSYICQKLK